MKRLLLFLFLNCTFVLVAKAGWWTAKLSRIDGIDITFTFEWLTVQGKPLWKIHNASEVIEVNDILVSEDSLFIEMPVFESRFRVKLTGDQLFGNWIKQGAAKSQTMVFSATRGNNRFDYEQPASFNISGKWRVKFQNSKDGESSVGEFNQTGNKITGTFLNATGDFRFLEGVVQHDSLKLSGFDGSHAFLFTAKINPDHTISSGKFYAGATYQEGWTATLDPTATISQDGVAMQLKPGEESLHFSFKDLDGKQVSINDDQFKGKVVIIQLMGSWCPNCMDETAFLSEYYNQHKDKGIAIIALAYEYTTNWDRSVKSLKKFRDRYNVNYTILNTEVTVGDSLRTEKTLPELTPIKFFPSSIILDKKGKVRKLDTGFNGPGTGQHFVAYKKDFETTIARLLNE